MRSFANYRRRELESRIYDVSVKEAFENLIDILRIDISEKVKLPNLVFEGNFALNAVYNQRVKEDYQENICHIESLLQSYKNRLYTNLLEVAAEALPTVSSLDELEREILAYVNDAIEKLRERINLILADTRSSTPAGEETETDSDDEFPSTIPMTPRPGAGSSATSPTPDVDIPDQTIGTDRPIISRSKSSVTDPGAYRRAGVELDGDRSRPAVGAPSSYKTPVGNFFPSKEMGGPLGGLGRVLGTVVPRRLRNKWFGEERPEGLWMKKEETEILENIFVENADAINIEIENFKREIIEYIRRKIRVIGGASAGVHQKPNLRVVGDEEGQIPDDKVSATGGNIPIGTPAGITGGRPGEADLAAGTTHQNIVQKAINPEELVKDNTPLKQAAMKGDPVAQESIVQNYNNLVAGLKALKISAPHLTSVTPEAWKKITTLSNKIIVETPEGPVPLISHVGTRSGLKDFIKERIYQAFATNPHDIDVGQLDPRYKNSKPITAKARNSRLNDAMPKLLGGLKHSGDNALSILELIQKFGARKSLQGENIIPVGEPAKPGQFSHHDFGDTPAATHRAPTISRPAAVAPTAEEKPDLGTSDVGEEEPEDLGQTNLGTPPTGENIPAASGRGEDHPKMEKFLDDFITRKPDTWSKYVKEKGGEDAAAEEIANAFEFVDENGRRLTPEDVEELIKSTVGDTSTDDAAHGLSAPTANDLATAAKQGSKDGASPEGIDPARLKAIKKKAKEGDSTAIKFLNDKKIALEPTKTTSDVTSAGNDDRADTIIGLIAANPDVVRQSPDETLDDMKPTIDTIKQALASASPEKKEELKATLSKAGFDFNNLGEQPKKENPPIGSLPEKPFNLGDKPTGSNAAPPSIEPRKTLLKHREPEPTVELPETEEQKLQKNKDRMIADLERLGTFRGATPEQREKIIEMKWKEKLKNLAAASGEASPAVLQEPDEAAKAKLKSKEEREAAEIAATKARNLEKDEKIKKEVLKKHGKKLKKIKDEGEREAALKELIALEKTKPIVPEPTITKPAIKLPEAPKIDPALTSSKPMVPHTIRKPEVPKKPTVIAPSVDEDLTKKGIDALLESPAYGHKLRELKTAYQDSHDDPQEGLQAFKQAIKGIEKSAKKTALGDILKVMDMQIEKLRKQGEGEKFIQGKGNKGRGYGGLNMTDAYDAAIGNFLKKLTEGKEKSSRLSNQNMSLFS